MTHPMGRALWLVWVGVVAAMHVGKLPPSLPVLSAQLGVTWVQGGFLLSMIQVAGMTLGLFGGLASDKLGPRRAMLTGLCLLALGDVWGAASTSTTGLLASRGLEGLGFLGVVLSAPGLIKRVLTDPEKLSRVMGYWGAYMPVGAALAIAGVPWGMASVGWPGIWVLGAVLALATAAGVWRWVPADGPPTTHAAHSSVGLASRLGTTLRSPHVWALALGFLVYSGQWLAVVGFLPTLHAHSGWSAAQVAGLTALVTLANALGNVAAGRALSLGVAPQRLLWLGYGGMALSAWLAYASGVGPQGQMGAVGLFSAMGGLVPGTLFALAVRLAPTPQTVGTTIGWMQQLSATGQFVGPPLVAALAQAAGGWQLTWWVNAGCAAVGMALAWPLRASPSQAAHPQAADEAAVNTSSLHKVS